MKQNNNPGIEGQIFSIRLNKEWQQGKYIMSCDPYKKNSKSYSIGITQTPKKVFGVKKIRGFKRVVELGWNYTVKLCQ